MLSKSATPWAKPVCRKTLGEMPTLICTMLLIYVKISNNNVETDSVDSHSASLQESQGQCFLTLEPPATLQKFTASLHHQQIQDQ